jgi:FtsH-binding integral membrane protein
MPIIVILGLVGALVWRARLRRHVRLSTIDAPRGYDPHRAAFRHSAPAWVSVYAAAVGGLWALAEATHLSNGWTVAAYIASLPTGPVVEVLLLTVFAVLGFDPTTSAPLWQDVLTVLVVIVAMSTAGFVNAFTMSAIVGRVRERRARRRLPPHDR